MSINPIKLGTKLIIFDDPKCLEWAKLAQFSSSENDGGFHLKQNVHAEEPLRDELAFCDAPPSSSAQLPHL